MTLRKKTSIKVDVSTLDRLNNKRVSGFTVGDDGQEKETYVAHDDFQNFLLDALEVLETTAKGETKAELQLKKFLVFGHDKAITAYEMRLFCGVNSNTCKAVIARYSDAVEAFNSKL